MTDRLPDGASAGWTDFGSRICSLPFRLRVRGGEHVPLTGAVVIVASHSSMSDEPQMFGALSRRVVFLVKQEIFAGPLGWFPRKIGQLSVRRGVSVEQVRDRLAELDDFRNRSVSGEAK